LVNRYVLQFGGIEFMRKKIGIFLICILFIVTSIIPIISGNNFIDEVDQQQIAYTYATGWGSFPVAQSFKPTLNMLTKVELMIYRKGNTPGTYDVSIRSDLNEDDLTSKSIVAQTIPDTSPDPPLGGNWIEFDFTDINVTPEQTYYIVIIGDDSWNGWNTIMLSGTSGDDYPRGNFWVKTVDWIIYDVDDDATFKTYGYWMNQPPAVEITYPSNDTTVSGVVDIIGSAADVDGTINKVEVKLDGDNWNLASGTNSWIYSWDTNGFEDGVHTIFARSFDGDDYSDVNHVNIIVNNSFENQIPIVNILYPNENDTVSGTILISGTASDPNGNDTIDSVEVKIDEGNWIIANGITFWNHSLNTTILSDGLHTITARCFDGELYSNYSIVNISVSHDLPDIVITGIDSGLGVTVFIKNIGIASAYNLNWSIDVEVSIGLILSGSHTMGMIGEIGINDTEMIQSNGLRGIGFITITAQADDTIKKASAFLLGPLVLRVIEL
jgi:hypothetical protein